METKLTNEQFELLLALDIQHSEQKGFTAGFAIILEEKGHDINKVVKEILNYVKPKKSLRMQLFGVAHNLGH